MNPVKLILLPDSQVRVIYDTGKEKVFKARGILMKPWGIKATLEGRKTHTRRIRFDGKPGELVYIREAYNWWGRSIYYHCDNINSWIKWKPGIHMPRTAARYWLYIKDVQDERLQDISEDDAKKEGIPGDYNYPSEIFCNICKGYGTHEYKSLAGASEADCMNCDTYRKRFRNVWDKINGNRKDKYGNHLPYSWKDNPVVYAVSYRFFYQGRGVAE